MRFDSIYGIAFKGDRFLMVYNKKRGGWEMPGGRIEPGETKEDALKREFTEESGYSVDIVKVVDMLECHVGICSIVDMVNEGCEMESRFFNELPKDLSFDREEYECVLSIAGSLNVR